MTIKSIFLNFKQELNGMLCTKIIYCPEEGHVTYTFSKDKTTLTIEASEPKKKLNLLCGLDTVNITKFILYNDYKIEIQGKSIIPQCFLDLSELQLEEHPYQEESL